MRNSYSSVGPPLSHPILRSPQVAILDFGSQYSHLIARRVRELNVFCELHSCLVSAETLRQHTLTAIVFSGGPNSVYAEGAPHVSPGIWELIRERQIPVLGICYGMQELAHVFGGRVESGLKHEYGKAMVHRVEGCNSALFEGMPQEFQMWMSHGDKVSAIPEGFITILVFSFSVGFTGISLWGVATFWGTGLDFGTLLVVKKCKEGIINRLDFFFAIKSDGSDFH